MSGAGKTWVLQREPCPKCGRSVAQGHLNRHRCSRQREPDESAASWGAECERTQRRLKAEFLERQKEAS
jgi:hypothetical protein